MYAGHDGNVYKNTGSGWQKYDNGTWSTVNTQQPFGASPICLLTVKLLPRSTKVLLR